jgi:hypothetical protein
VWLAADAPLADEDQIAAKLAHHVDVVLTCNDLDACTPTLGTWIEQNPHTIFDVYLLCDDAPPSPDALTQWRAALPYQPGYLDRVAVFLEADPGQEHRRVSPRVFVVLPWTVPLDPETYGDLTSIVWQFELNDGDTVPWGAWTAAGGAGVWLRFDSHCSSSYRDQMCADVPQWEAATGRTVWFAEPVDLPDEQHVPAATHAG